MSSFISSKRCGRLQKYDRNISAFAIPLFTMDGDSGLAAQA